MSSIEVGQGSFSKVMLCIKAKSQYMKRELAPIFKRVGTCMVAPLDVLTWTRDEKQLLTRLDKMEPLLGIVRNDL